MKKARIYRSRGKIYIECLKEFEGGGGGMITSPPRVIFSADTNPPEIGKQTKYVLSQSVGMLPFPKSWNAGFEEILAESGDKNWKQFVAKAVLVSVEIEEDHIVMHPHRFDPETHAYDYLETEPYRLPADCPDEILGKELLKALNHRARVRAGVVEKSKTPR